MPTLFSDPSSTVYVLLTVVVLVAIWLWFRSSQTLKAYLYVGLVFLLVAGWVAVDRFVESPREEAVRRMEAITAAVNERKRDELAPHIADTFDYHGMDRDALTSAIPWHRLEQDNVRIAVYGFERDDVHYPDDDTIIISFMAKGEGQIGSALFYTRATFARQPDDSWLLVGFKVFDNPLKKANGSEMNLPGLG